MAIWMNATTTSTLVGSVCYSNAPQVNVTPRSPEPPLPPLPPCAVLERVHPMEREEWQKIRRDIMRMRFMSENKRYRYLANFDKRLEEIVADAEKNAWKEKHRVSFHAGKKDGDYAFWTIGREGTDFYHPAGEPTWRTYRRLYNDGWLGLTVQNFGWLDLKKMMAFTKPLTKKGCRHTLDLEEENFRNFWFAAPEAHDAFADLLRTLEPRLCSNKAILPAGSSLVKAEKFLRDAEINYIKRSRKDGGVVIAYEAFSEDNLLVLFGAIGEKDLDLDD